MMDDFVERSDRHFFDNKKFKKKGGGDKFKNKAAKHRKFKLQKMQEEELDDDIRDWEHHLEEEEYQN